MCMASTPTIDTTPKPVEYLHNPYLDGITIGTGATRGRNSLRVDLGTPNNAPAAGAQPAPSPTSGGQMRPMPISTPGMVIPTIGGSAAGSLPPNVTIAGAKTR